jgi:hypothetical protein
LALFLTFCFSRSGPERVRLIARAHFLRFRDPALPPSATPVVVSLMFNKRIAINSLR